MPPEWPEFPLEGSQCQAKRWELRQSSSEKGEFSAHGFLDRNDVNVLVAHILDELAVPAIMTKAANVPKKGPHLNPHRGAA